MYTRLRPGLDQTKRQCQRMESHKIKIKRNNFIIVSRNFTSAICHFDDINKKKISKTKININPIIKYKMMKQCTGQSHGNIYTEIHIEHKKKQHRKLNECDVF